jgi:Methyltransferase domain
MISANDIYRPIFKIWRRKRFQYFLEILKPKPSDILLDVGGYPGFWTDYQQPVSRIDSLNVHQVIWENKQYPDHNFRILTGNGCHLEMKDQAYDIGFSNSVIEHVGSWENQKKFASEIRRVSKSLWVQTPAYECPIEPHYMMPLIHYLSIPIQKAILRRWSVRGLFERLTKDQIDDMVDTTRLLTKAEMSKLFPDCKIKTERLFFLIPKSYIAIRIKDAIS